MTTTARGDLLILIRLQKIFDRIAERLRDRATPPDDVDRLMQANEQREAELRGQEERIEELEEELRTVRRSEEEHSIELAHFQKQKAAVTNERQFRAVINEIDFATTALREAEERRRELEDERTALTEEIEERRRLRPEEEQQQNETLEAWEQRKAELQDEVHRLMASAKELTSQLQPPNRSRFQRLLDRKNGVALAAVVDGSCSLCHFELRPHLQQRVRRAEEIITCEYCHRILYLEEMEQEAGRAG